MVGLAAGIATGLSALGAAKLQSGAAGRGARLQTDAANRAAELQRQKPSTHGPRVQAMGGSTELRTDESRGHECVQPIWGYLVQYAGL